jgi:hypothetical protein
MSAFFFRYGDDFELIAWEDAMNEKNKKLAEMLLANNATLFGNGEHDHEVGDDVDSEAKLQNEKVRFLTCPATTGVPFFYGLAFHDYHSTACVPIRLKHSPYRITTQYTSQTDNISKIGALEAAISAIREELQFAKTQKQDIVSNHKSTPEHIQKINTTIQQLNAEKVDIIAESFRAYREMLAQTGLANSVLVERLVAVENQLLSVHRDLKTKEDQKEGMLAPDPDGRVSQTTGNLVQVEFRPRVDLTYVWERKIGWAHDNWSSACAEIHVLTSKKMY